MDPLTEQILRLKNQQKTFSNRLEERRSQYEEANKVASERFTGALGKSNIQPSEVFGALNTFQRAGQSILEPTSNDLANIEQMLLSAEKERYSRQPSAETISQKDLIDLQIKAKKEGLDLVPDETGQLRVVSKQVDGAFDPINEANLIKSKYKTLEDIKDPAQKQQVQQELQKQDKVQADQLKNQAVTLAKELLGMNIKGISGFYQLGKFVPGSASADALAKLEQLKSVTSLDNIKYLRGTGAITDKEQEMLQNALGLSTRQSEKQFKKALEGIAGMSGGESETDQIVNKYWK